MLLAVSRVNESIPLFIVDGLKTRLGSLNGRRVAVIGLAFKADTDDERDSLSHKLIRLLERELADVSIHDPLVARVTSSLPDAVIDADAIVIATDHTILGTQEALRSIIDGSRTDAIIADPWNSFGQNAVFAPLAALRESESSSGLRS
jgi:UDP-N-acetyl-D-mannosaminuronic acid dehydrogenase